MSTFEVVLVARTPQLSGPPILAEVNRLVVDTISYTDELNRSGSGTFTCPIASLSDAVKDRLNNLANFPCEVRVYRDSTIAWAGEVQTIGIQEQNVALNCSGLLAYTFRMGVTSNLIYSGIDQFTIAKGLVDHWQVLDYGNFGIDTSSITTSGVLRDRTYLKNELHNSGQRLQELGAVINGFDIHVNPVNRKLVLSFPERGTNLSASVFFDKLNIASASVAMSVAPEDLVTDVHATGTSQTDTGTNGIIYTTRSNATLRQSYGRSFGSQNFDGVSVLTTLEGHADAYRDARNGQLFQPGVSIKPRVGADIGDFGPGDSVTYSYDAGLGLQSGVFRIAKVVTTVAQNGEQRLGVDFT